MCIFNIASLAYLIYLQNSKTQNIVQLDVSNLDTLEALHGSTKIAERTFYTFKPNSRAIIY
jgi:hypothetical protein